MPLDPQGQQVHLGKMQRSITSGWFHSWPATRVFAETRGRQDRLEAGYAFTLKMYADLINAQGYDTVSILDPHSAATPALIDRVVIIPHNWMVRSFLLNRPEGSPHPVGLICPDAGAEKSRTSRSPGFAPRHQRCASLLQSAEPNPARSCGPAVPSAATTFIVSPSSACQR